MSFWDIITGLFTGDTYYPDNPNREARLKQLNDDCSRCMADNEILAKQLKENMQKINAKIRDKYPDGKVPEKLEIEEPVSEKIPFDEISLVFSPLLSVPAISGSLLFAHVILEAKDGNELAAVLEGTLGLAVLWVSGGMFFGIVPIAGMAIGALEGSLKRDELKKLIPKAVKTREQIYGYYFYNKYLNDELISLNRSMDNMLEIYSEEEIIQAMQSSIEKSIQGIKGIESTIKEKLQKLDKGRNAWTEEDYYSLNRNIK